MDPGGTATFSVVADLGARSLSYQWQRGWNDLAGETGPSLTIANADASKVGDYKVLVSNNYKIGWIGSPDWHNYTRAIPAGSYTAYAALSYDGSAASQLKASLSKVTAGVGTANQTLQDLGLFDWPGSRGWGRNNLVPLKDASGAMAVFSITDPNTTLRMSHTSGDFDWLMLVPTDGGAAGPRFTSIQRNTDGTITVEWTGGGTLEAGPTVLGPWQAVPGATSPYTLTPDQTMLFGRIRQ